MQRAQKHLREVTSRMESAHEENVPTFPFRAGLVAGQDFSCLGQAAKKRKVCKLGHGNMGTLEHFLE